MRVIRLRDVGPIKNISMDIDNGINIIIGEQASGKSTLAKEIYFFKKIRDYFIDYLCNSSNFTFSSSDEQYIAFLKSIRSNYMESFGTTKHLPKTYSLTYTYGEKNSVSASLDEKNYVRFKFSAEMETQIRAALDAVKKIYDTADINGKELYNAYLIRQKQREDIASHFGEFAKKLFFEEGEPVYIPAGRSMLSVMSEQMDVVDVKGLDLPMRDFVRRIRELKSRFGKKLPEVVTDYVKTIKGQIKNKDVELAMETIEKILHGQYVSDADGEKLYIDSKRWVKLIYSSSGQQEALWILNMLFISILENKKTFFIIEEPEAHLFPLAQKYMMEMIALTHNSTGSQVLVTTHSPYILTSTNLLIYSGLIENRMNGTTSIVDRRYRLSEGTVKAYRLRTDSSFSTIMDESNSFINAGEIDEVSEILNNETDKMIRMEFENDL